jgi:hypothetical protein
MDRPFWVDNFWSSNFNSLKAVAMPKIYLPNLVFTMMRPHAHMPTDQILFRVPRNVNKIDIKNYLSAVYGVKALQVNTVIEPRRRVPHPNPEKFHKHPQQQPYLWKTIYKRAFVTLSEPFSFPAIPSQIQIERDQEKEREAKAEEEKKKRWDRYHTNWSDVVAKRYGDVTPLGDAMCDALLTPLQNMTLDVAAEIQGAAKNRMNPGREKLTRRQMNHVRSREIRQRKRDAEAMVAEQAGANEAMASAQHQ